MYEMCFPFSTNMERIYVIQNLRLKEIVLNENINQQAYEKQVKLRCKSKLKILII